MNDEERLDLSALAPAADDARWRAMVTETLARVDATLARRAQQDPLTLIAGWTRAITTTAVVVVILLVPVELVLEKREGVVAQAERLTQLSQRSIRSERGPSGAELSRALHPPAP